jgi:hypothetical protein
MGGALVRNADAERGHTAAQAVGRRAPSAADTGAALAGLLALNARLALNAARPAVEVRGTRLAGAGVVDATLAAARLALALCIASGPGRTGNALGAVDAARVSRCSAHAGAIEATAGATGWAAGSRIGRGDLALTGNAGLTWNADGTDESRRAASVGRATRHARAGRGTATATVGRQALRRPLATGRGDADQRAEGEARCQRAKAVHRTHHHAPSRRAASQKSPLCVLFKRS